jgi:hypothetical protein
MFPIAPPRWVKNLTRRFGSFSSRSSQTVFDSVAPPGRTMLVPFWTPTSGLVQATPSADSA